MIAVWGSGCPHQTFGMLTSVTGNDTARTHKIKMADAAAQPQRTLDRILVGHRRQLCAVDLFDFVL
jgi:hypothetical protein